MFAGARRPMELCVPISVASTSFNGITAMTVVINKDGNGGGSGGYTFLGLILGAVLVVVAAVGFLMWDNYKSGGAPKAIVITGQAK
jgi:hypothetical protein